MALTTGGAMTHHDSMDVDLRYISEEKNRHGRMVVYARWKGKRIRLKHPASSPEFIDEYREALKLLGLLPADPGKGRALPDTTSQKRQVYAPKTLGWLVLRYFNESPAYKTMTKIGQGRRRRILESVVESHGHKPMIIPTDKIAAGIAKRADNPGAANDWLKSMKALYTWALSIRLIKENPAAGVSKLKTESDGFYTWTLEDIGAYFGKHPLGSMGYLACILLLFTGLRRSDAVKLGRQHVRADVIRFKTSKTGAELVARVPWPLRNAIEAMEPSGELPILLNGYGKPFASGAAFGNWFKDRCTEASIPHCTAHGLRKAGATIAAEMGSSEVELDAMYGWSNNRQSGTYTRAARNLVLATSGFNRIADALVEHGLLKTPPSEHKATKIVAP